MFSRPGLACAVRAWSPGLSPSCGAVPEHETLPDQELLSPPAQPPTRGTCWGPDQPGVRGSGGPGRATRGRPPRFNCCVPCFPPQPSPPRPRDPREPATGPGPAVGCSPHATLPGPLMNYRRDAEAREGSLSQLGQPREAEAGADVGAGPGRNTPGVRVGARASEGVQGPTGGEGPQHCGRVRASWLGGALTPGSLSCVWQPAPTSGPAAGLPGVHPSWPPPGGRGACRGAWWQLCGAGPAAPGSLLEHGQAELCPHAPPRQGCGTQCPPRSLSVPAAAIPALAGRVPAWALDPWGAECRGPSHAGLPVTSRVLWALWRGSWLRSFYRHSPALALQTLPLCIKTICYPSAQIIPCWCHGISAVGRGSADERPANYRLRSS